METFWYLTGVGILVLSIFGGLALVILATVKTGVKSGRDDE